MELKNGPDRVPVGDVGRHLSVPRPPLVLRGIRLRGSSLPTVLQSEGRGRVRYSPFL